MARGFAPLAVDALDKYQMARLISGNNLRPGRVRRFFCKGGKDPLALTREQKEEILQGYVQRVARAQVMVWAGSRGLTVKKIQELRRQLRSSGAEAVVVKNTLMRLALERANRPVSAEWMNGPCVVTFLGGDVAAGTKALADFARSNDAMFQLRGGVVGGQLATVEQVISLITLPSREVMLARVLGGLQAPISGLVGTLAAVLRGLVNVLDARAKQLEGTPS
jgi:large subunit ribosomal protein L10